MKFGISASICICLHFFELLSLAVTLDSSNCWSDAWTCHDESWIYPLGSNDFLFMTRPHNPEMMISQTIVWSSLTTHASFPYIIWKLMSVPQRCTHRHWSSSVFPFATLIISLIDMLGQGQSFLFWESENWGFCPKTLV
jgi:hypothetical protein